MDIPLTFNPEMTVNDGLLRFEQKVDELGKSLQSEIAKSSEWLNEWTRYQFDQITSLAPPSARPPADILGRIQKRIDALDSVVQVEIAKMKHLLEPLCVSQSDEISQVEVPVQATHDMAAKDFLDIVAKAYEISMEWSEYLEAARDPTKLDQLKPYIIYLDNTAMPDRRTMMIIHPPGLQKTRESKFISPPANGSKTILAPVHGISGIEWSEGVLVGDIDPYDNWHHTRRVDLCPGRRDTVALYGDDVLKPIIIGVMPFKAVISQMHTLLDAEMVYGGFMMYSNAFAFGQTPNRDHPSFEATRCFDYHTRGAKAPYASLFF
jgi:hypothetical protein